MEEYKKKENEKFFKQIIRLTVEGGVYVYPATGEVYTVVNGILYGTKNGVKIIKGITPKSFHGYIREQAEE